MNQITNYTELKNKTKIKIASNCNPSNMLFTVNSGP